MSPALAGRFLTTGPPGKYWIVLLMMNLRSLGLTQAQASFSNDSFQSFTVLGFRSILQVKLIFTYG